MSLSFVAFDLDGTVFTHVLRATLSPRVRAALEAAHDAGARIIAVSGRPWLQLGRDLMTFDALDWVVGCNGACIVDARSGGAFVEERTIPWPVVRELVRRYHTPDSGWNAFLERASYYETTHRSYLVDGVERSGPIGEGRRVPMVNEGGVVDGCWFVDSVVPYLDEARERGEAAPFKLIIATLDEGRFEAMRSELLARGDLSISVMGDSLEITLAGVDKGDATLQLLEGLGVDPAKGVSFGDAGNDITMCGRPWRFVAMGNAEPQILAAADDVTDSVTEDGVATWIEAHLLDDLPPVARPRAGESR